LIQKWTPLRHFETVLGKAMAGAFDIGQYDALFATRTTAEDWAHIIAFRNRAHFRDAALRYIEISGPFYRNNFFLNKILPEAWRFQMIALHLHLHDARDPNDPRSGLTLGNFQRVCKQLSLASPGRAFAFLSLMRVGGYLTRASEQRDARVVRLEPTPLALATLEKWNDGIFEMIDCATPEISLLEMRTRYPQLGREMRRRSAERLLGGWQPLAPFPEVFHFAATDGGWMLLARCVTDALRGGNGITPVSIKLDSFGKEYGGSRSHLRRLLEGAYADGLLEALPANGADIRLSPRLTCAFMTWFASYLAGYQRSALEALAALEPA
jgi:hypothetical protein